MRASGFSLLKDSYQAIRKSRPFLEKEAMWRSSGEGKTTESEVTRRRTEVGELTAAGPQTKEGGLLGPADQDYHQLGAVS